MNTPVRWCRSEGDLPEACGPESKGDYMIGVFKSKGFPLTAPNESQWNATTSRPKRSDAQGRQIDMVGCKHAQANEGYQEGSQGLGGTPCGCARGGE